MKRKTANDALVVTDDRQFATQEAEEIRRLLKRAARDIVVIGQKLIEVKARLKHGEWGAWLRDEFDWDERTAQRFMNVGECFKNDNLSDLDIAPSALYLLASPSTPDDIRQSILEQARAGAKITLAAVRNAIGGDDPKALPDPDERYKNYIKGSPWSLRRRPKDDTSLFRALLHKEITEEDYFAACDAAMGKKELGDLSDNARFYARLLSDDVHYINPPPNPNEEDIAMMWLGQTVDGVNAITLWIRENLCTFCYGELPVWGDFKGCNPWPFSDYGRCCNKCDEDHVKRGRMVIMLARDDDVFYADLEAHTREAHPESFARLAYDIATKTRNGEPEAFPVISVQAAAA